ncbi:tyrosine-type recombinase/integrase [Candidatus Sodalis endolongispinus]|uniref:tyrosine-type recombinase/integrase n=1 Tax=Candidatus Sodalis endolongispinus TaxID=2812662 RepID=UPI001FE7044E|nr:site-specific integrase [Candidatus Sodalis endolongispinus]
MGLKVYPYGRKIFVYKYHKEGARKFLSLGDYPTVTLAEATAKAITAAANITAPETSIAEYAIIKQLFDDYITTQKKQGNRSYDKTKNRLNQVLTSKYIDPATPAKEITPVQTKRVLAEFIERGANAGANKIRANLHAVFNFGLFADNDPANINGKTIYGLDRNPVSVIPPQKRVDKALDSFLSWDELSQLLRLLAVTESACPIHPDFAQLTLLCIFSAGQRPWEIMTNTRDQWDEKNKTLTVPPNISKNSDLHIIPLNKTATEILKRQREKYPDAMFIFPGNTKEGHLLSAEYSKQLRKFCKLTDFNKFTTRDILRTFKTLAGDMGISAEMRDRLQNHKRPGVSAKHYDRYDYLREKREIIEQWEKITCFMIDIILHRLAIRYEQLFISIGPYTARNTLLRIQKEQVCNQ